MSNEKREQQIRSKAKELGQKYFPDEANIWARGNIEAEYVESACVEMAEWLDQHPHWIPVEERLPEVGKKVIFYSPGIDDWLSGAFQQDGTWWNEEYGTHFYGVTHWMEIVPPRKEE